MTLPEFMAALNNVGPVRETLRLKTAEEILAMENAEKAKVQAAALKVQMEQRARRLTD